MFRIRRTPPPARDARVWSNGEIARIAEFVTGDVINVSAWRDEDKQGRHYRDYFARAASYSTSNFGDYRGGEADHQIDLEQAPHADLVGRFDMVFNHTTLEHVFEVHTAFDTICALSRDAVLLVVPFMQHLHGPEDGDFWRISPYAMRRLLSARGFHVVYESAGPAESPVRYTVHLASRTPEEWAATGLTSPGDAVSILRKSVRV